MIATAAAPVKKRRAVYYPESDGKPLAETDLHLVETFALFGLLKEWFRNRDDVYVASCNFVFYTEGNPKDRFSPDCYVVMDVPKHIRRSYKIWEEKKGPSIVFEITSRKTRHKDSGFKKELCAKLNVREYFLYDPEDDYLKPPLQGYKLVRGVYHPIVPDASGALRSDVLQMDLRLENKLLAVFEARTGARIWRTEEAKRRAEEDARNARLKAMGAQQETERAQQETERAQLEANRIRKESAAEIARLRDEIRRLKNE